MQSLRGSRRPSVLRSLPALAVGLLSAPTVLSASEERDDPPPAAWGFEDPAMLKGGASFKLRHPERAAIDAEIKRSGAQSLRFENTGPDVSASWFAFEFPHDRRAGEVSFEFYLRTEGDAPTMELVGVTRELDDPQQITRFPISIDRTGEWVKASGTMPVGRMDTEVSVAVQIRGAGRFWVDDFSVTLDGAPYGRDLRDGWDMQTFAKGSGISIDTLDPQQTADIALLARVWGFLKYHHPEAQNGSRNWDNEFLALLRPVMDAEGPEARDRILIEWLRSLGEVPDCDVCAAASVDVVLPADDPAVLWRGRVSPELDRMLGRIYANRETYPRQFFAYRYGAGRAFFDNELTYPDMDPDDDGFRLLAVARYWNMVRYWFPYRDLIDEPWEPVLEEALADIVRENGAQAYSDSIRKLVARVDDTHAQMNRYTWTRPIGGCFPAPHVRYVEGLPLIAATGGVAGLETGDLVVAVDGVAVKAIEAEARPHYSASNEASFHRDLGQNLLRGYCQPLRLTVARDDRQFELEIPREDTGWYKGAGRRERPARNRDGAAIQRLEDGIVYVGMGSLTEADLASLKQELETARAAIFDLRGSAGQVAVHSLLAVLTPAPVSFAGFSRANAATPGEFEWIALRPIELEHDPAKFAGPIAILVDETVQSSGEYMAMGLQSVPGSFTVGSTTAGADGNITRITLPGGLYTMFSGIGVFYPDRQPTQRVGIRIDHFVAPTVAGIRAGIDEQFEAAIDQVGLRLLAISGAARDGSAGEGE